MSVIEAPAPITTDPETEEGEPQIAHIAERSSVAQGYVLGTPITALCGAVFVPSRDPDRYPVCETCTDIKKQIVSGHFRN